MDRFFVSGCQRSGTTMLRLILNSHINVKCFDEAISYEILVKESQGEPSDNKDVSSEDFLGFKIPRFAEQLTWDTFSDPDYGEFPSFYRDEKVIFIFRDVFDVIASMIRLKTSSTMSWLDKYGRSILRHQIVNPSVSSLYKDKYLKLEKLGFPRHLVGALYWEIKNQGFWDLKESNKAVFGFQYEKLVSSPRSVLAEICCFLNLPWDDSVLYHHRQNHSELDDSGYAIGGTNPRRSIDKGSIGLYRSILTEKQREEVINFAGDSLVRIKEF